MGLAFADFLQKERITFGRELIHRTGHQFTIGIPQIILHSNDGAVNAIERWSSRASTAKHDTNQYSQEPQCEEQQRIPHRKASLN